MGREFELKFRANGTVIQEIQKKYQDFSLIQMETSYYDSIDGKLSQRRWTLRMRRENRRQVCTLKTPLPDGSRGEWETECGSIEEGVLELCKLDCPGELALLCAPGLVCTCGARFTRLAKTLELPQCTVELALDQGVFLGGSRELAFGEIEVELKEGSEEAAVQFAHQLAREFGLVPEHKSKVQRALENAK